MTVRIEWDSRKAATNRRKHGISFDEASTIFDDPLALIFPDDEHSSDELRELMIGHSVQDKLVLVSFTEREPDIIRIISARLATRKEIKDYEKNNR
ncbi:MAG: BrnT family toxin [Anaerolineales bacterium]|jgi:uncharacterized DUF497 family protein|nr:BrnT family toxin [Anaerolineales bacterium]